MLYIADIIEYLTFKISNNNFSTFCQYQSTFLVFLINDLHTSSVKFESHFYIILIIVPKKYLISITDLSIENPIIFWNS